MNFLWPQMLWLLLFIPALVIGYLYLLRRRKVAAMRHANLPMVRLAMGRGGSLRRHLPPAALLLALTTMILAIARPEGVIALATQRATVLLAMDVSGSMRAVDIEPSRMEASRAAARAFIETQPRDVAIGITAFAGTAFLVQPPTLNRDDLAATVDRLELQRGTAVGSGILVSLQAIFPEEEIDLGQIGPRDFQWQMPQGAPLGTAAPEQTAPLPVEPGSYESVLVILLTDGRTTTGPDPIGAARLAADRGVRVFTVGFGTPRGDVVEFAGQRARSELDEEALRQIAEITRAQYFHAGSEEELQQIYELLSTQFVVETKRMEITALFAAVAAALTMASALLSTLWFGRIF
jgi:Ca-activated chloride channel family protein